MKSADMGNPTLLMTRPRAAAEQFVSRLRQDLLKDVNVLFSPLIGIKPLGDPPNLDGYAGVIFSSGNGVAYAPNGAGRTAFCVGNETAQKATDAGWTVLVTAIDSDALVERLTQEKPTPLVHLCGRHRRGRIAERLSATGMHVDVHSLYDQVLLPISKQAERALEGEAQVIVPLFSPRTAMQFAQQVQKAQNLSVLAMSRAVAAKVEGGNDCNVLIAGAPTGIDMIRGVENLLCGNTLP